MASDLEIEAAARGIAATKFLSPEWPGSIRERDGFNASMVNAEWPRYVADARAALEAAEKARRANYPEILEGWKLVPIEPTEAMKDEGRQAIDACSPNDARIWASLSYRAMLSASPEPTKE